MKSSVLDIVGLKFLLDIQVEILHKSTILAFVERAESKIFKSL